MEFIYPAIIENDGAGHFLVTFPDILFAATEGKTIEEALIEAQDCLETAIASCIKDKENIPVPSKIKKGEYSIRLAAQTAAKAALYVAVLKSEITNSELARRLGTNEKEIRRMLDPWHPTKLPRIELALSSLGYQLSVTMGAAA